MEFLVSFNLLLNYYYFCSVLNRPGLTQKSIDRSKKYFDPDGRLNQKIRLKWSWSTCLLGSTYFFGSTTPRLRKLSIFGSIKPVD